MREQTTQFCPKCGRIVRFDPYFAKYICVECGTELSREQLKPGDRVRHVEVGWYGYVERVFTSAQSGEPMARVGRDFENYACDYRVDWLVKVSQCTECPNRLEHPDTGDGCITYRESCPAQQRV